VFVSIGDMLKFSSFVYHYHQPPDAYNAKLLFNHLLRRAREFLEKVRNGGRHGATVADVVSVQPRVVPTVVCRSAAYWQKSTAGWKNVLNNYLTTHQSGGFAARFAKNFRSGWVFGSWREAGGYRGLTRKVAMFGFVGVAVANRESRHLGIYDTGNDDIYSAIRVSLPCSLCADLVYCWCLSENLLSRRLVYWHVFPF